MYPWGWVASFVKEDHKRHYIFICSLFSYRPQIKHFTFVWLWLSTQYMHLWQAGHLLYTKTKALRTFTDFNQNYSSNHHLKPSHSARVSRWPAAECEVLHSNFFFKKKPCMNILHQYPCSKHTSIKFCPFSKHQNGFIRQMIKITGSFMSKAPPCLYTLPFKEQKLQQPLKRGPSLVRNIFNFFT